MALDRLLVASCLSACACLVAPAAGQTDAWRIDGTSRVLIHVGRAGAFGFAGHAHEVAAPVSGRINGGSPLGW